MRKVLRVLLPIVVLALGIGVLAALAATRPKAARKERAHLGTPVRVLVAQTGDHPLRIAAQGQVIPERQVTLAAELNGRVIWRHPELVPGGIVQQGDLLIRIDPRDYRAAVDRETATLENTRVLIQTEQRRRAVAEREWEILSREGVDASPEGRSLSLREPQLRSAEASVAASQAQLSQARLTLSRTQLRAPFHATVLERSVELGQLVGPSARLATLVGTDHFWVQVSLPFESLRSVQVPDVNAAVGSTAHVEQAVGDGTVEREGHIVRLLPDLDPAGRMARVLVEIDDPLGLSRPPEERGMPMLLGASVRVDIDAGVSHGWVELPRRALREGDVVWVVGADNRLAVRPVRIGWRRVDTVLVSQGLAAGERVIVSALPSAVAGMALRVVADTDGAER